MVFRKDKIADESQAFVDSSEGGTGSTQSSSDEESLKGESKDPDSCCRSGARCCCCCCLYSLISTAVLVGLVVLLALTMNTWVRVGLEEVGNAVFGTDMRIGAMNLGLQHGRATITNMTVSSPPGYKGSFFDLGRFVFELSPRTVLAAWISKWSVPVELHQLSIRDIKVFIDMNWTASQDTAETTSNAQTIVKHMNQELEPLPTPSPEEVEDVGLHALEAKIKADLVELTNINASVVIRPFISTPIDWDIKEVVVREIGARDNGVYVWEFVEILTRAIMMAIIKGAPDNVRANLAKIFGPELVRDMNLKNIMVNTGKGLSEISEFSGWAAGEATLLPLRFTEMQAKITGKAIETQAKLGWEATKMGAKMTGMGIKANLAATNTAVKMGVKANEEAMKIRNAFTMGWMHAIR